MATLRLDHASIVVDDLESAIAFFAELGMELDGATPVEGDWVDRLAGLPGVKVDIAMMRTPEGGGRLELTQFQSPAAVGSVDVPPNTRGLRTVMFAVDDVDDVVTRLQACGGALVGEIVRYEDAYRLCYVRGPGGAIIALAEALTDD